MLKVIHNIAVAFDYCLSMLLWLRVETPMTVSSECGLALRRGERWTPAAILGRMLNAINSGHTEDAIAADLARCQASIKRLTDAGNAKAA